MRRLRAALILDNSKLSVWQKKALEEASEFLDIQLVLNCKNTKTKKSLVKNFLYYLINIFSLKNKFTKRIDYDFSGESVVSFDSQYKGAWQTIPVPLSKSLSDKNIEVVIKFGMSLLRINEHLEDIPVLSFHHGDPSKYRGRPAGFYELLYNEEKSGLIVQRLTNQLDAGEILAFAESKLTHYSYKKSAEQFYAISHFLLKKALINLNEDRLLPISVDGKNYRLPSNLVVLKFLSVLFYRRVRHLIYGVFFEKKWKVGTVQFTPDLRNSNQIKLPSVSEFSIDAQYNFYADPFFSLDGSKVRLEALGNQSGLGDIIEIDLDNRNQSKVLLTGSHYSYPFSFSLDGKEKILPEVASHSPQYFIDLDDENKEQFLIKGLEDKRLADATLLEHNGWWYLFFGENNSAHAYLNLWISKTLTEPFTKHPSSPVCISPTSARMAGRILRTEDGFFRFGQNNNRAYGAAITISEITEISPVKYEEKVCGSISIDGCLGPHSIDFNKDKGIALIDYYNDELSLFAGVRRFKALLSKS